jgi:pSer/pThr/pTyr-binding forkhead associated (FHA) protein
MTGWILESRNPELVLRLPADTVKTLGRTAKADFILDAGLVSRVHCRLTSTADELSVEDLDSTNGTHVNGRRVKKATLKAGDVLGVGRVELEIKQLTTNN